MVSAPPLEASSNELADWLELEAFASANGSAPLQAINQALEIGEDEEPEELDDENQLAERRLSQVVAALDERIAQVGASYPFQRDPAGATLSLKDPLNEGGQSYLFCLIVSAAADDGPLSGAGPWAPNLTEARRLFQICATVATAGYAVGPAFSVGWPRPDSSTFLQKLAQVYGHLGDGAPHTTIPPGAPAQVKDDEIDVIGWTHSNQAKPPLGYFLGQAASGADWEDKTLKGRADTFHTTWFQRVPASTARVGTLIPFFLSSHADADPTDHESQAEIEGAWRRLQSIHGEVLHRHRIAWFLQRGVALHGAQVGPIERVGDLPEIAAFVSAYRLQLQGALAPL